MGKWKEQQEVKKERREQEKFRRENLAKFFFDLAKLSFAGLVIGAVIPLYVDLNNLNYWYILLTGVIATIFLAYIGNELFKQ